MKNHPPITLQGLIVLAKQAIEAQKPLRAATEAAHGTPGEDAANLALEEAESRGDARIGDVIAFPIQTTQDFAVKCAFLFEEYRGHGAIEGDVFKALDADASRVAAAA